MSTIFRYPKELKGEELDELLSRGWFRMQQSIFTCRYLFQEGLLSTAVWLRLPLKGYTFSKSLRYLLSKNGRTFSVEIKPFEHTAEKELLYQHYKNNFKGRLSNSLYESLGLDRDIMIFRSWQVEIRDGDKLIGFNIFDKGAQSIQGICMVYDFDYAKYSLGLYSMLLVVQHAISLGLEYFYPGYIAPGRSVFEYKLRTKGTEFFDPNTKLWYPIEVLNREELPSAVMYRQLEALSQALDIQQIDHDTYIYPPYQVVASDSRLVGFFAAPIFLDCYYYYPLKERVLVHYHPVEKNFQVGRFFPVRDLEDRFFYDVEGPTKQFYLLMRTLNDVFVSESIDEICDHIGSLC